MDHDHSEKALHVLARLHAHGDTNDAWVLAEFEQIQASIQDERPTRGQIIHRALQIQVIFPPPFLVLRPPSVRPDDWCLCHSVLLSHYLRKDGHRSR